MASFFKTVAAHGELGGLGSTGPPLQLSALARLVSDGGSAWESNPAPPRKRGATDFEDREGHRAPFASATIRMA